MKKINNEQGFTLIELMVVVLIIGILVAVAVPVFVSASKNAKTQTCKSNLRTLDGAIQTYSADNQSDPTTLTQLVPKYVKRIPNCPVDATHAYSFVAATSSAPAQSAVTCGTIETSGNHTGAT